MAISVDTVYQRVLALANKEQRGYITPQEFNLLAAQAQMEIFEQYFYDQNQADRNLKNSTEFSNPDEILDEKLSIFKRTATLAIGGGIATLPNQLYRLGMVYTTLGSIELEQLTEEEALYLNLSPIAMPTADLPAFVRTGQLALKIYPASVTAITCNYIIAPTVPNWHYVVVNEKALYNPGPSVDFELHDSDMAELVYKILALAGIVIAKVGIKDIGNAEILTQKTQEKQ